MATERQSPDVLIVQTNLTGTVSAIQDDPDSPDGNWLTYITNNVNTVCRVSFPTPTGNPTVGAGLQEFKIWVRKQPGTGTPTVAISLYENGVLVAEIMAATNVTSATGQLFSATWNANLLGTADGSLVECYILGTAVGGAPTARCTVEVGAIEWNVTYTSEGQTFYETLNATSIPTMNFTKQISKILEATSVSAIVFIKKTSKALEAISIPIIALTKKISKILGTASVGLAILNGVFIRVCNLVAITIPSALIGRIKTGYCSLVAITIPTIVFIKKISKSFSIITILDANIIKKGFKSLVSTTIPSATMNAVALFVQSLNAVTIPLAGLGKKISKNLIAVTQPIGTFIKKIYKTLNVISIPTGIIDTAYQTSKSLIVTTIVLAGIATKYIEAGGKKIRRGLIGLFFE